MKRGQDQDRARCARIVAEAAHSIAFNERLWLCPVNEPALYPLIAGMPMHEAVGMAITMARVARDHHPDIGILTNDPITGIGERQFAATDAIVAATDVDVVGVNYYPHTARTVLIKTCAAMASRWWSRRQVGMTAIRCITAAIRGSTRVTGCAMCWTKWRLPRRAGSRSPG